MFKEIFIKLCNQKGVSPSAVCREIGIAPATFSCWTEESVPRKATLMRIAEYFGVSVDYLLGKCDLPSSEGKYSSDSIFVITAKEFRLVEAYRAKADMQKAVDKILGIDAEGENEPSDIVSDIIQTITVTQGKKAPTA